MHDSDDLPVLRDEHQESWGDHPIDRFIERCFFTLWALIILCVGICGFFALNWKTKSDLAPAIIHQQPATDRTKIDAINQLLDEHPCAR